VARAALRPRRRLPPVRMPGRVAPPPAPGTRTPGVRRFARAHRCAACRRQAAGDPRAQQTADTGPSAGPCAFRLDTRHTATGPPGGAVTE
jgi:hypothetical protein